MRTWILEDRPDYEPSARYGLYVSPNIAWDDLFELVQSNVFKYNIDFSVYVGADPDATDPQDRTRSIVLLIRYRSGDEIRLSGESVKGHPRYGYAPSVAEWRDLQQVGSLLRMHAVQTLGYECTDPQPERTQTGRWHFSKPMD